MLTNLFQLFQFQLCVSNDVFQKKKRRKKIKNKIKKEKKRYYYIFNYTDSLGIRHKTVNKVIDLWNQNRYIYRIIDVKQARLLYSLLMLMYPLIELNNFPDIHFPFLDYSYSLLNQGTYGHVCKYTNHTVIKVQPFVSSWAWRELRALIDLQGHPGIVKLVGLTAHCKHFGIILPKARMNLWQWVVKERRFVPKIWYQQLINAIKHMHSKQWVHRDLKPNNVLINDDLQIEICDFGMSVRKNYLPKNAWKYCTKLYRPPDLNYPGFKGDMWSLGCMFVFCISSITPFPFRTDHEIKVSQEYFFKNPKGLLYSINVNEVILLQKILDLMLAKKRNLQIKHISSKKYKVYDTTVERKKSLLGVMNDQCHVMYKYNAKELVN